MEDSRQGKKGGQKSCVYGGSGPQRIQVVKGTVSRYIEPGLAVGPKSPFTSAH